jgi:hypothetical protein
MAAVKTNLYIALVNAGVPEGQAAKLAAADAKLNIESALIAALEPFAKMRKLQQTLEDGCREMMAKDNKGMMDDDRDRPIMKSKVLQLVSCGDRGGGPTQRRYRIEQVVNSVEYHPGDFLTPDEVRALCDSSRWQVHIFPEREPLTPRETWPR